jgi:hypothetical protein
MLILHGLWFDIVSCYALVRCSAAQRVGARRATSAVCLLRWLVPTGWAVLGGLLLPPLLWRLCWCAACLLSPSLFLPSCCVVPLSALESVQHLERLLAEAPACSTSILLQPIACVLAVGSSGLR